MGRSGHNLWLVIGITIVAGIAGWLTYAVWRSPDRINLATLGQYTLALALLAGGLIARIWQLRVNRRARTEEVGELDQLADLLALAVEDQWARVADEEGLREHEPIPVPWRKPALAIAGPPSAAVRSQRFAPLPGLGPIDLRRLDSGWIADLHAVYGGLGSGRLVIVGEPGSGKSGAATLLVLAALKHRRQQPTDADRHQVPVPVLFPLNGWDPETQPVQDWLAERLQVYPLLTGKNGLKKAIRLVAGGKITVILDDLDGMEEPARPVALRALSQQAAFRLIVLSRTAEMESAAAKAPLATAAAVELRPVIAEDAAEYLTRTQLDPAPPGWGELIGLLRRAPDSPIAHALSSPLNLTLVRDTYREEDEIKKFLGFSAAPARQVSDIENYLIDRLLPASYTKRPGDPPLHYDLETARHALRRLAVLMGQDNQLRWWEMRAWEPAVPRIIATGIVFGIEVGIAAGLGVGIPSGVTMGLTAALTFSLLFGFADSASPAPPRTLRHVIRPSSVIHAIPVGLALGGPLALAAGLAAWLTAGSAAGLAAGLTFGLAGGLTGELYGILSAPTVEFVGSLTPRRSWRTNQLAGLAVGLTGGIAGGLAFGIVLGLSGGLATALASGFGSALAVGRTAALTRRTAPLRKKLVIAIPAGLTAGSGIGLAVGLTTGPPIGLSAGLQAGLIGGALLGLSVGLMKPSTWSATLAFVQLAAHWAIPFRLMDFLEDARDHKVLRTVGPAYQFRHARLRDRLSQELPAGQG